MGVKRKKITETAESIFSGVKATIRWTSDHSVLHSAPFHIDKKYILARSTQLCSHVYLDGAGSQIPVWPQTKQGNVFLALTSFFSPTDFGRHI